MESIPDINLLIITNSLNQMTHEKIDLKKWLGTSSLDVEEENE